MFALAELRYGGQLLDVRPREFMERRALNFKPRMTIKSLVRGLPYIIGLTITAFIIGYETSGLTLVVLMLVALVVFGALCLRANWRSEVLALRMAPCPQCGQSPMKFDRSLEGDFVFTGDKCQIEWTLDNHG